MQTLLRLVLVLILSFQVSIGSQWTFADPPQGSGSDPVENALDAAAQEANQDPYSAALAADAGNVALLAEQGRLSEIPVEKADPYHLRGQTVERLNERGEVVQRVSLDGMHDVLPLEVLSSMDVKLDAESGTLIFEGIRYGKRIARHLISDVKYVSLSRDKEFIFLLDARGNLDVIDMGFAARAAFQGNIQIHQKLWEAPASDDMNSVANDPYRGMPQLYSGIQSRIITRGTQPLTQGDIELIEKSGGVIRKNEKGQPIIDAGDLYVFRVEGGKEIPMHVFSRRVTYERILQNSTEYLKLLLTLNPSLLPEKERLKILSAASDEKVTTPGALSVLGPIRDALLSTGQEFIKALRKRTTGIEDTVGSAGHRPEIPGALQQERDQFTLEQWQEDYRLMIENAQKRAQELRNHNKKSAEEIKELEGELKELEAALESGDLSKHWKTLINYKPETSHPDSSKFQRAMKPVREFFKKEGVQATYRFASLTAITIGLAVGATYVQYGFTEAEGAEIIDFARYWNWFHQHYFPPVLKDAVYRGTLGLSVVYQHLAAIAAPLIAIHLTFGPGLKLMAKSFKKLADRLDTLSSRTGSKFAGKARDWANMLEEKAQTWGEMNIWTKLVTAGNRLWAPLILPLYQLFRPGSPARLKVISAIGNLFKNQAPAQGPSSANPKESVKVLKENQKKRAEFLAWTMAALAVSERSGIDPVTILASGQGLLSPEDLATLTSDKNKMRLWEETFQALKREILRSQTPGIVGEEVKNLTPEELRKIYNQAGAIVQKIKGQDPIIRAATRLRSRFEGAVHRTGSFLLNLNLADHQKLSQLRPNDFVVNQTRMEFISDTVFVILYTGLFGGRADLSKSKELMARADSPLATHPAAISDLAGNTVAHLLKSGSGNVLVYQGELSINEDSYTPKEDITLQSAAIEESYLSGFSKWFFYLGLTNPKRFVQSNTGAIAARNFIKSLTNIQASLILLTLFRIGVADQSPEEALRGFWLVSMQGFWAFAWPWILLRQGNLGEGQRIAERNEKLESAKKDIVRTYDGRGSSNERAYENLFELYQKDVKKQVMRDASKFAKAIHEAQSMFAAQHLDSKQVSEMLGPKAADYYGLVSKLVLALQIQDPDQRAAKTRDAYNTLIDAHRGKIDAAELRKLNALSLVEYSIAHPPFPTKANPWVAESTTFWFGAILTTALAIPLFIDSYTPAALSNENLLKWTLTNIAGMTALYYGLGKKPWERYKEMYAAWKANREEAQKKAKEAAQAPSASHSQEVAKETSAQEGQQRRGGLLSKLCALNFLKQKK